MSEPIRDELLDLLRAVVEALDLPMPSIDDADERAHARILNDRTRCTVIALRGVLDQDHNLDGATKWLRAQTAETPATYTPWQRPETGGAS